MPLSFKLSGSVRLWIAVSLAWVAFASYRVYTLQEEWSAGLEASKAAFSAIKSEQAQLTQSNILAAKKRHEEFVAAVKLPVPSLDERRLQDEAYTEASKAIDSSGETDSAETMSRQAFEARTDRDTYLKLLFFVPLGLAAVIAAIHWVAIGFRKHA